ncbi:hypothetical protein LINGRAHAP2_LOCUS4503 [Linum grandiflorum]
MEESGKDLRPYHVHGFWRSMEYRKPPEVDKWEAHDAADRTLLEGQVQKVCEKGAPSVRALSRLIWSEFQPETDGLKEPKESDAPRGRPRKKATLETLPGSSMKVYELRPANVSISHVISLYGADCD